MIRKQGAETSVGCSLIKKIRQVDTGVSFGCSSLFRLETYSSERTVIQGSYKNSLDNQKDG